ncbi:MAG: YARHG domain-containing protein [Chitinophagaceae bacterium]|nr:YARHG domain-containing protein [Chitinophagaceae bacterium]
MAFCTKCGKQNLDNAKFCTSCGATLTLVAATPVPLLPVSKNKNNWILIAIIAILVLSIGAYFIFFNKKSDKEEVQTGAESNQTIPGSYPYASQRLLIDEDVMNLSQYNLRIMRNEIYARHGYIFQNTEMKNYFSTQAWYSPLYNDVNSMLSAIEKSNIELIKRYEKYVGENGNDFYR